MTFDIRLPQCTAGALALAAIILVGGSAFGARFVRPAAATAAPTTVPFFYEEARLYVPVKTGGRSLGDFILDTGSSRVVIDSGQRQAAGLTVAGHSLARGAGTASLPVGHAGALMLDVAGAPLALASTETAPIDRTLGPYTGHPIGGIVGAAFFRRYVVTIDFRKSVLELREPSQFAYGGPGVRMKLRLVDEVPLIEGALVMPDGKLLPLRLLVDLGAKANLLIAEPFVAAHHLLRRLAPSVIEPLGAGVGGKTRYAFARLPGLRLDDRKLAGHPNLVIGMSVGGTLRGGDYDALLGAQFLHRYRVTLDYSHGELILEPVRPDEPDRFDRSGMFLTGTQGDPHRIIADEIVPDSPAAKAGLRAGDVLKAVDGRSIRTWSLAGLRRRFASTRAAIVGLKVERAGSVSPISLRLRRLL